VSSTNKAVFTFPEKHDTGWMQNARCRDLPYDEAMLLFFPEKGQNVREGKRFCLGTPESKGVKAVPPCPVREQCLAYALTFEPEGVVGVWGGTTAAERHKLGDELAKPKPQTDNSDPFTVQLGQLLRLVASVHREADNLNT